jgi:hypothetical protein
MLRKLLSFAGLLGVMTGVLSSCGGTSTVSNGPTAQQACAAVAKARCTKIASCSANVLAMRYGDEGTCETRETQNCVTALAAPSTGNTPAATQACATALGGTVDCGAFFLGSAPAECATKTGGLANGAACAFPAQCASAYCAVGSSSVCGTCAAAPAAGAACDTTFCPAGLECASVTKTCGTPVQAAAPCDNAPCAPGTVCAGTAGNKACQAIASTAASGQPCGLVAGARLTCAGQGFCVVPQGQTAGTCLAAAADGAACDLTKGPLCQLTARCVGGTCQLPGATACP